MKPHLDSIVYIRAVACAAVVAIHIGALYLANPTPNLQLVALFSIVSRFAVPIFFFLSAFGIFYQLDSSKPFNFSNFYRRRARAVLLPYILWSAFYLIHDSYFFDFPLPDFYSTCEIFACGLAKFHLYFLVILCNFYLLIPLWLFIVPRLNFCSLFPFLASQIAFNFWATPALSAFCSFHLNWLPLNYLFIFLLGAYLARHSLSFFHCCDGHKKIVSITFLITLIKDISSLRSA